VPEVLAPYWPYVLGHVACLLLARVDGKSPAEYLSVEEQAQVRRFGEVLLAGPPGTVADLSDVRRLVCR
jgi:hypothetical protein